MKLAIACVSTVAICAASFAWADGEANFRPAPRGGAGTIERPKDFGAQASYYTSIEGAQIHPRLSSIQFERGINTGAYYCVPGSPGTNVAYGQFPLPHGAVIEGLRVWFYDGEPASQATVTLQSACLPDVDADSSPPITDLVAVGSGALYSGGAVTAAGAILGTVLVDNQSCTYRIRAVVGTNGCDNPVALGIYKARVQWRRAIAPAPATATFNDVPTTDPFFQVVEALAATGITAGCGGGNFCPAQPVTRAAMAAFLARALGLPAATIVDPANP